MAHRQEEARREMHWPCETAETKEAEHREPKTENARLPRILEYFATPFSRVRHKICKKLDKSEKACCLIQ